MQKINDTYLIKLIQQNSQEALEILHQRYFRVLCNFSESYVCNKGDAEEIVTDVFLSIWSSRDELNIKRSLKTYLFSSVKHRCFGFLSARKKSIEHINSGITEKYACGLSADSILSYCETLKHIESLIEKLPPQRRQIFKMSKIEGFTYAEIAEALSISIHTVQKQMTKSIRFMEAF